MEEGEHRFAVVLEEAAVALGIIPPSAARQGGMWPVEGFTIFDAELVRVELVSASVSVTALSEIQQYERTFAKLTELAVYGAEARALILAAIDALG